MHMVVPFCKRFLRVMRLRGDGTPSHVRYNESRTLGRTRGDAGATNIEHLPTRSKSENAKDV